MKTRSLLLVVGVAIAFAAAGSAQTRTFSGQYSFGDSLSDSGNLYALSGRALPPAPYFNGRFSNGPVFTELLGNPLLPAVTISARRNNLNFAFGGATAIAGSPVPNLSQQVAGYRLQGAAATPGDLFTVLAGANDLNALLGSPAAALDPALLDAGGANVARAVATSVRTLVDLGAKNIVVGGLPNLGATPAALARGGIGGAGSILGLRATNAFNQQLRAELQGIASAAPADVNLVFVDLQAFLDAVISEGATFGFANTTSFYLAPAARGGGVGDPNSYVFWDDIHPTARTHALLATYVLEHLNPEPALGFAGATGTAALALQGLAANAIDARAAQVAAAARVRGRADAYASYHYADATRSRDGWRPKFDFDAHVVAGGVDFALSDGVVLGGAVNAGRLDAKLSGGRGVFAVEDGTGRLYGVWRGGPVSLVLDGAYGVVRVKNIKRTTALGVLPARGKTSGDQWGGGIKAQWAIDTGGTSVRPWFGLRTTRVQLDAYTERDGAGLALEFGEQEAESTVGSVGIDAARNLKLGARSARIDVRGAWHGEIGSDTRTVSGRIANNFMRPSLIDLEDGDGSGVEVGGALTVFLSRTWSASVGYAADIRTQDSVAHRASVSVQTGF